MNRWVRLDHPHSFLGGRGLGRDLRDRIEFVLRSDVQASVALDLAGVQGVSHSFADELLSPLSEWLGDNFADRVILANCSPAVVAEFELVAAMHDLFMPAVASDFCRAA